MKKLIKQIIGPTNSSLIRSWFKSKAEKELLEKRRNFYQQFLRSNGAIYFDVGANMGNRIEPLIGKDLKIIAVEPQPSCIKYLLKKFGRNIIIVEKGLGSCEELREMNISNAHTLSSFSEEWIAATKTSGRFKDHRWNEKFQVEITTLDHLIKVHGKPDFIKIDVEGFELEVLKGLSQPVGALSFEYTVPESKAAAIQCIDRIVEVFKAGHVGFNYSVHESMEWAMEDWMDANQIKQIIESQDFINTGFGDIYAKEIH